MIQFANDHTKPLVREMWKTCFGDSDDFLDIHFSRKYRNDNTLIYFEGDRAAASLQMLPYNITIYGKTVPFAYLAGLCTLPQHRRKGYMAQLICRAHEILGEREIPLSILVPAEDWLFSFYEKYGYEQVFDKGQEPVHPLKQLLYNFPDINDAYRAFNALYRGRDFCVQKSLSDFETIVADQKLDSFPPKYTLSGMACVIDELEMLDKYACRYPKNEINVKVNNDNSPSRVISLMHGSAENRGCKDFDAEVDKRLLCRLLFGYKTDELGEPYKSLFPVQHPVMDRMLE